MKKIEIHKEIDAIVKELPQSILVESVQDLISRENGDIEYFFALADERWLTWLWENGFLDIMKTAAKESDIYGFQTPEISYFARVAEKVPGQAIEIIMSPDLATTSDKFRPELIDQILRVCMDFSADNLVKVVPKISDQKWVALMTPYFHWTLLYQKMLETLVKSEKIKEFFVLAEAILSTKNKGEIGKTYTSSENPFYLKDITETKIFDLLLSIDKKYSEQVFDLATNVLGGLVLLGDTPDKKSDFRIEDTFHLFDVDFFELESKKRRRVSPRDDVRELCAVIVEISRRLIEDDGLVSKEGKIDTYKKYVGNFDDENPRLPDSRTMWRLRLYILSLQPDIFSNELRRMLWRPFDIMESSAEKTFSETIMGAEYQKALKKSFSVLSDEDKKEYVNKVITLFSTDEDEKTKKWKKIYGSRLLSVIGNAQEIRGQIKTIEDLGFKVDEKYEPKSSISTPFVRSVKSKGIVEFEEFNKYSAVEISEKLKTIWTPEKLNKYNEENESVDEFSRENVNADGMGNLLIKDVNERLEDYVHNSSLFFDVEKLDPHYTYSFVRGVQEAVKNGKNIDDWSGFIKILLAIIEIDEGLYQKKTERGSYDVWLFGWENVFGAMTDVMQELLSEKEGQCAINVALHRNDLLTLLSFLLRYPDPVPVDEELESAKMKTGSYKEEKVTDPYNMAINSVRGRAFQAFLFFVYQDGKELKDEKIKIKADVKELYESIIDSEDTRSLMFMFGHHFPAFYFRDKQWMIESIFDKLFYKKDKEFLRLAALEGYLTQVLYKEIFIEEKIQGLYQHGIELTNIEYPQQENFRNVHDALADHLALAFSHFEPFNTENRLFLFFWDKATVASKKEFISFIGRSALSRETNQVDEGIDLSKIKNLWDWVLENEKNSKVFMGFGYWIKPDAEILDDKFVIARLVQTLEKSNGEIEWDYAFKSRLPFFAKVDQEKTFIILQKYLLSEDQKDINKYRKKDLYSVDREIKKSLEILYENGDEELQGKTYDLIDKLITYGGQKFWTLKEVLKI